jgi:hypothetical protein
MVVVSVDGRGGCDESSCQKEEFIHGACVMIVSL